MGSAALPGGLGLAIGAFGPGILAPALVALGLAMCGVYALLSRYQVTSEGVEVSSRIDLSKAR